MSSFVKIENKADLFLNSFRVGTPLEANHFSYVGGKYNVPDDAHEEWLKTYAKQLQSIDSNLYMIEKRTPIFRMYFDLDMIQPDAVERAEVLALTRLCCDVFRQYFPERASTDNVFTCYVLSAPSMERKGWPAPGGAPTETAIKTGFHLIWPFLFVDQRQSLFLREGCVFAAKAMFGERQPPSNPFADVIDETVLLANGLRMVGSDKASKCLTCGGDGKDSGGDKCKGCLGAKMKPERRVYTPLLVLNAETNEPDRQLLSVVKGDDDVFERVRLCTVRVINGIETPGFRVPAVAAIPVLPSFLEGAAETNALRRRRAAATATSEDREHADTRAGSGRCALTRNDTQEIAPNTRLFALVNEFIRKSCPSWSQVVLIKFFVIKARGRYVAKVNGVGATYCLNAGRMHTSSTVFFVIDALGMRQRCFSRKQMPAGHGACKDFASGYFPLPDVIRRTCFEPTDGGGGGLAMLQQQQQRALAPVNGFVDKDKQMFAVEAAYKLHAALQHHNSSTKLASAPRDPATAPAPPAALVPSSSRAASVASLPQLELYGNFTPKQLDQMSWMELTALTKQQVSKAQEAAKELQAECFADGGGPTVIPLPPKRRRSAAAATTTTTAASAKKRK